MTNKELITRIKQLESQYRSELEDIQHRYNDILNESESVQQQLIALQQQLDRLRAKKSELEEKQSNTSERLTGEIFQTIHSALEFDRQALIERWKYISERQQLKDKRDALLSAYPERQEEWEAYLEFEANRESILADLPWLHRKLVQREQSQLQQRLQPIIEIEQQLEMMASGVPALDISFFLYHNIKTGDISLVIPQHVYDARNDHQEYWSHFSGTLNQVFFQLMRSPEITVLELEGGNWDRFLTYDVLAEYHNGGSLPQMVKQLLAQQFESEEFWRPIQIQLISISDEVWERGRRVYVEDDQTELTSDQKQIEEDKETIHHAPASDKPSKSGGHKLVVEKGWYTRDDVISWRRSIKSTTTTGWSKDARIVRTMFIRMIAKGYVGNNQVPKEHLWQGLPSPETEKVQVFVERFIERSVLQVTNGEHPASVSINPDFLDEVQTIINRSVDDFWDALL